MDTSNHHLNRFCAAFERFVELTDEEWLLFSQGLRVQTLKKKSHFIKAGSVCKSVGLIVSGSVRYYHIKDGEEITGYFSIENDWMSAYNSFLTQQPSLVNVQALEDTGLVTFSYSYLQQCYASPQLAYKTERFSRLIAEYLISCYEDRVTSFILQSPEERYLKLLQNSKGIMLRIPQHYIANYLGITPVSLSRIRKRLLAVA